jgi:hypothetical protein
MKPTAAIVLGAKSERVVLLLELERKLAAVIDAKGLVRFALQLEGDDRRLGIELSDAFLGLTTHEEIQAAAQSISPSVRAVLENPDELTVFGVITKAWSEPRTLADALIALKDPAQVSGTMPLRRPKARQRIGRELVQTVTSPSTTMMCWEPRHALLTRTGTRTVLVVLCFECGWGKLYDSAATEVSRVPCDYGDFRWHLAQLFQSHGLKPPPTHAEEVQAEAEAKAKADEEAKAAAEKK